MILLDPIGAPAPGVHVEGAVLLLRPGVVVLERQGMTVGEPPIDLHKRRAGVVGARDRLKIPVQGACIRRVHPLHQGVECGARRARLLFHVVVHLFVVGNKEERLVLLQRAPQREPELMLPEIGFERLRRAVGVGVRRRARHGIRFAEVVHRALELVRAGLGNHVHEAGS